MNVVAAMIGGDNIIGFSNDLIAPCGINCGVCLGYLREKNKCGGCLTHSVNKVAHCANCRIKFCEEHKKSEFTFCYECEKYPCGKLKHLDKRYTTKYKLNVLGNLEYIKEHGIEEFVQKETEKWRCKHCGETLSVHRTSCIHCGKEYR